MKNNEDKKPGMVGLFIGMAIGVVLGILFAPQKGEKTQKDIKDRAEHIAKKFNKSREEVEENVRKIFGDVSDEFEKAYTNIHGEIMALSEDLKEKKELTKEAYDNIIEETVNKFSRGKDWTEKSIRNLTKNLKDEWDHNNEKR